MLLGLQASGKSSFCKERPFETHVFDVLHYIAAKRLAAGRLTVVDTTNVQREARPPLVKLARGYHTLPVAIVFNLPEDIWERS